MHVLKDPDSHPEIFEMLRSLDLIEFNSTYLSLASLLARLRNSTHTQVAFATPPGRTTIPQDPNRSGGSTLQPHQVHLPNQSWSHVLKMLRPTSSVPHILRSPNG